MGMFDSVYFRCPNGCENPIEEQSKAGKCRLDTFSSHEVPSVIALDILGGKVFCGTCKLIFEIEHVPVLSKTMALRLK